MRHPLLSALLLAAAAAHAGEFPPPRVVATPPADAGRGLVRVSATEIRHYDGSRKAPGFLVSRDNGETWKYEKAGADYPPNYGGIPKESPAFAKNPKTGEFIRVQPIKDHVFLSKGGLDGKWVAVTKDGKTSDNWRKERGDLLTIPGIMRTPLFIDDGKRVILPSHGGSTSIWISDDGGLNWRKSKNEIKSPPHTVGGIHKGLRWQNSGVEATVVELKNGTLWALVRTSQDYYYESFSKDRSETWSKAEPSRFAGTLTMPTLGRLPDGRLLMLWTNQMALPEVSTATGRGEDAFTNRDTMHAAISADEGKTWAGFREVGLDEHRARPDYATWGGPQDRGNHQAEFEPLDKNRLLIAYGQHKNHRRMVILDTRWLLEKERRGDFSKGAGDWLHHTFIPVPKGHCSYNRKPAASVVDHPAKPGVRVLDIGFLADADLVNEKSGADYRAGGAAWNFPAGSAGKATVRFRLPAGSAGVHLSLMDRLFAACDRTAPDFAAYTVKLAPGANGCKADTDHTLVLDWSGTGKGAACRLTVDGKPAGTRALKNAAPNGLSYLHFIAAADKPGPGVLLESVGAEVR